VRHLLDVRIRAREPARRRANLPEVGVQTFRYGIDQLDHVLPVTRQCLLDRAVFEQRADDGIVDGERLQFPVTRRVGYRNTEPVERLR
jgi:hypothetical protein